PPHCLPHAARLHALLATFSLASNLHSGLLAQQPKNLAACRRFVVNDENAEWRLRIHSEAWEICAEVCKGTRRVTSAPPLGRFEIRNCWRSPYKCASRSLMFESPTPRTNIAEESVSPSPQPLSKTCKTRLPSSRCAATDNSIGPFPDFIPWRSEFSSSGCRTSCGTRVSFNDGSIA